MAKSDISAGRAFVELYLKDGAFVRGLQKTGERLKQWGQAAAQMGARIFAAGAAIGGGMAAAVASFAAAGDQLDKTAARTGVTVESLSQLGFAAEQSGADIQTLEKAFFGLSRALFDLDRGGAVSRDAFAALGISLEQLKGQTPEQQLHMVADGLAAVEDMARRGAIAQQIFGRSGRQLLPMLARGSAGLREFQDEANALGLTVTAAQATQAAAVTDALNRVRRVAGAAVFQIGAALAPLAERGLDVFKTLAAGARQWLERNASLVRILAPLAAGLAAAGAAMLSLSAAVSLTGFALTGLAAVLGGAGAVLATLTSPLALISAALIGGAVIWARYTEAGRGAIASLAALLGDLTTTAQQTLGGIVDALASGDLALAGRIAIVGLRGAVLAGLAALADTIGGQWGATVATIGNALLSGDVQTAWAAGADALGATWRSFTAFLVDSMAAAGRGIVNAWEGAVSGLSDLLLSAAADDGILGQAIGKLLGVDLAAELKRSAELDAALGLEPSDPLAQAQQAARDQISGAAAAARGSLDELAGSFRSSADDAAAVLADRTAGAGDALREELAQAQQDLEALTAQAAAGAEKTRARLAAAAAAAPIGDEQENAIAGPQNAATFSAAALQLLGGGGPQDLRGELRRQQQLQADQLEETRRTNQRLDNLQARWA